MLSGDFLGTGLIDGLLSSQHLIAGFLSGGSHFAGLLVHLAFLLVQPSLKFLVGFLFSEGAFFHSIEKVIVVHDPLELEDGAGRVAHLGTDLQPVEGAVVHHVDGGRVGVGVVRADFLDEAAVALGAGVGSDNVVEGLAFLAVALEAEACGHVKNVLEGSETQLLMLKNGRQR